MDSFERIADGKALEGIRKTPGFYALERLLKKLRDDAITALATDATASRKETKGFLRAIEAVLTTVDDEIAQANEEIREEEETIRISRGQALEGGGTGDLT